AGISERVCATGAALWAESLDLVAGLGEQVIGMRQLTPPEPDRPATRRGSRGIGNHDRDPLLAGRIHDIGILDAHRILTARPPRRRATRSSSSIPISEPLRRA